jgi:hypothetical protein
MTLVMNFWGPYRWGISWSAEYKLFNKQLVTFGECTLAQMFLTA